MTITNIYLVAGIPMQIWDVAIHLSDLTSNWDRAYLTLS